jgi:hypothetical protein
MIFSRSSKRRDHLRVLAGSGERLEPRAQGRYVGRRAEHASRHLSLLSESIDPKPWTRSKNHAAMSIVSGGVAVQRAPGSADRAVGLCEFDRDIGHRPHAVGGR